MAEKIVNNMDCVTEACFSFMRHVRNLFNNPNLIAELLTENEPRLRTLLQNFVQPSAIEINGLIPMDPHLVFPLEDAYLGEECERCMH
ncbi:hypothetical protein HPB49_022403 [Dermacentor silvarum]|uniref:Uncharacterized protein n=1 Tax=Dermacentor silvarum TaxID=543639 RepID=A0ACB8CHQ6_DERSI|nr:hypothetical protein HPB49_022403 [Dermacentor silvarum]